MRRLLLLLSIAVLFIGCDPCKRLARKCPPVIRDSIVEIVRLDTLILTSPAETLRLEIPIEVPLEELILTNESSGPSLSLEVRDGILEAEVICPEDSLRAVITELETRGVKTVEVPKYVPEPYVPKFYKSTLIYAIILTLLIAVYIYLRIKGSAFFGRKLI